MVNESLEKGWRTWSAQATELQLLRDDKYNRRVQGAWFFKRSEEAMAAVQEDLAHYLYELAANHREEITRFMEEFHAHDIDTSIKLDDYEREWRHQTDELGPPPTSEPPNQGSHEENQDEDDDDNNTDYNEQEQEAKPSLYNILHDDDDEEDNDNEDENELIYLE